MRDIKIEQLIKKELQRQTETLDLIPSENIVSHDVLRALGSPLTNKYAEGYPHARYYGGNIYIDEIEELARTRALKLFGLSSNRWSVNVQPYSGSPANMAVYAALVPLGEKIMGLRLDMGGHLTHGHRVSFTGKAWRAVHYDLDPKTERLDYSLLRELAEKEKPKLIVAGFTAYSRRIDFKKFRAIADSVGAYLMVDMSHIAGLVAGKAHPSPFPHADVVTSTTHKTLRGPRGAVIFSRRQATSNKGQRIDIARGVDRAVFPGLQGGPHMNQVAAMAVAFREASTPAFRRYAKQIVSNARTLAGELAKYGFRIVSGGTDTHLFVIDLSGINISGKRASDMLEKNGIIVNKNMIPYDPRPPMDPSGIRMGTPTLTTRGMKEKEMKLIARLIADVLLHNKNVSRVVRSLCSRFPVSALLSPKD